MKRADCWTKNRRLARWAVKMGEQYTKELLRRFPGMRDTVTTRFKHRIARERRAIADLGEGGV